MDEACRFDRGLSHVASHDVEARRGTCCQQRHENGDSGTTHNYFLSNTITTAAFEPRTDSTVMVLPSGDNDLVSLRTTFGPPATALSLVHVVTSLPPSHLLMVSLGPPIGDSLVAAFPVRSKWVLLSSALLWNVPCVVISSDESDCW